MSKQDFLDEVATFREDLKVTQGWDALRALWARQVPPYRVTSRDPLSGEYREEILALYERMTDGDYALVNEMTSTKVAPADFARGYPWMTNNLGVAGAEVAKVAQAFRVMQAFAPDAMRVAEFGSGWGNLALALAQAGRDVTAIDIDEGFIKRSEGMAERAGLPLRTVTADFLTAARACDNDFDAVIFQSSFHHCIDFNELTALLRAKVLRPEGRVFFFSEPVFPGYPYPWGLRTDGESLWAITANKWCELGFDRDFFVRLLLSHGFLPSATGAMPGVLGDAWVGTPAALGLPFEEVALPERHDGTFHPAQGAGHGRFLRAHSVLPVPGGASRAVLSLANFGNGPLTVSFGEGGGPAVSLAPGARQEVEVAARGEEVTLLSDTFVPHEAYGNGDERRAGPALLRLRYA